MSVSGPRKFENEPICAEMCQFLDLETDRICHFLAAEIFGPRNWHHICQFTIRMFGLFVCLKKIILLDCLLFPQSKLTFGTFTHTEVWGDYFHFECACFSDIDISFFRFQCMQLSAAYWYFWSSTADYCQGQWCLFVANGLGPTTQLLLIGLGCDKNVHVDRLVWTNRGNGEQAGGVDGIGLSLSLSPNVIRSFPERYILFIEMNH